MILFIKIKNFVIKHTFLFLALFFSLLFSTVGVLFMSTFAKNLYFDYIKYEENERLYSFKYNLEISKDLLDDFITKHHNDIQRIYVSMDTEEKVIAD